MNIPFKFNLCTFDLSFSDDMVALMTMPRRDLETPVMFID